MISLIYLTLITLFPAQPILRARDLQKFLSNLPALEPEDQISFEKEVQAMREHQNELKNPWG